MRETLLLVTPFALLASTWAAFKFLGERFGPRLGYFLGFLFYWLFWCLAVPLSILGLDGMLVVLSNVGRPLGEPLWLGAILLLMPLALGYGYAFPRAVRGAGPAVFVGSLVLALVNATLEELLWRGAYVYVFPDSVLLAVVLPAAGFGAWHLAPQVVHPSQNPGGALSFVTVSALLGLMWGWVAFSSSSIVLTSVAHVLFDFSGLGARVYLRSADEPVGRAPFA